MCQYIIYVGECLSKLPSPLWRIDCVNIDIYELFKFDAALATNG